VHEPLRLGAAPFGDRPERCVRIGR
jgi:hypothetical protein